MAGNFRNERKFALADLSFDELLALVHLHPAGFRAHYAPRKVNNVYFDSFDLHSYHDNVKGTSSRYKVRLRWYGELEGKTKPALQVKIKHGSWGAKKEYPADEMEINSGVPWSALRDSLRASIPSEARIVLDFHSMPTVVNSYNRHYFISADGNFRLTIDRDIKYYNQANSPYPNLGASKSLREELIMEVKYPTRLDDEAKNVTSWFPFRVVKNSKYISGLDLIWDFIR